MKKDKLCEIIVDKQQKTLTLVLNKDALPLDKDLSIGQTFRSPRKSMHELFDLALDAIAKDENPEMKIENFATYG